MREQLLVGRRILKETFKLISNQTGINYNDRVLNGLITMRL